ncbi:MAG TPA: hypothetical protein VF912_07885 [Anaeromyxobacter sp.]
MPAADRDVLWKRSLAGIAWLMSLMAVALFVPACCHSSPSSSPGS